MLTPMLTKVMIVIIEVLFVIIITSIDANGKDRSIQVPNDQLHRYDATQTFNKGTDIFGNITYTICKSEIIYMLLSFLKR